MTSRIRLFNRSGSIIQEINTNAFYEWVINDIGTANFSILASGMENFIQFGNYVVIENDKLDTWVGVITTPRPWGAKSITVNASSAMSLFQVRVGSYTQPVSGSWGAILSQMIGIVNSAETTLLRIGNYESGVTYSSVVDMSNLYTYLQRALVQAQARIDFRPVVTNGKLKIFIDMNPSLYTVSSLKIKESQNVKAGSASLIEQGEIYNDITVIGIGLDSTRYTAHVEDSASIALYGRRQFLVSEGQSQSDVDNVAAARIVQYAWPRSTLSLTVTDKGTTLNNTRVGYRAAVELQSLGYLSGSLGFKRNAYINVVQIDDTSKSEDKSKEAILVFKDLTHA